MSDNNNAKVVNTAGVVNTDRVVNIERLSKVYGAGDATVHALRDVTVDIRRGEFVAIMGHSGSGKSTLMNILGTLDRPTSGSYTLDGVDVSRLSKSALATIRNEKIGFIFQSFNLLPRTSAINQVMLPTLYMRGAKPPAEERERQARSMLESVGLGERMHHRPNELSGGQQQRVAIARALINRPAIVLADEPTGNLDSKASEEIMAFFRRLRDEGITIVMVTHEPDIANHADRVICLRDGSVISDGRDGSRSCIERVGGKT